MKPTLYLMLGYPGAGKTTVAKLVSEITGAEHIWADHERKIKYGQPSYSQTENDELYSELNHRTESLLREGKSVMFDTAFNHYEDRKKLENIARTAGADTVILWVQTPREVAKKRATTDLDAQPTRVLNDQEPLHHEHFEYLSDKLEEPRNDETVVILNGTDITKEYVSQKLRDA